MARVDETKIFDREVEAETFGKMVRMVIPRRVMVVSDKGGMGKTDLLRKLRLLCERDYDVPVALLPLEDFASRPDEFAVVSSMHKALRDSGAHLPSFDELNQARALKNTTGFLERLERVAAVVDMRNAAVTGAAKIAAMMINVEHAQNVVLPPWSEDADAQARALCVEAFLADLRAYAQERPVALLFDSVEKIGEHLRRWVLSEIVRKLALTDWESRKLVIVLAGQGAREMVYGRLPEVQHNCIEPVFAFQPWTAGQVREFLEVNDLTDMRPNEVEAIHSLLTGGHTLAAALMYARLFKDQRMAGI
jgi:hypothetical protein